MSPTRRGRLKLGIVQVSLLVFALGIVIVGRNESAWPVITWILYSGYSARFQPPPPTVSVTELRVRTEAGRLYRVKPEQLLTVAYDSFVHSVVAGAFEDDDPERREASRRYLAVLVHRYLDPDSPIETVEAWRLTWDVAPRSVPPIRRDAPREEELLGRYRPGGGPPAPGAGSNGDG